ncbi:hypothetical protein MANES_05G100502v8 [Manihot esculenta]|uniref:Uncharacterized protein n=1 Tax=Manihot esculenta TaxID=3983 RepID=A0ACB7HTB3_MANES|nr:hypothetical protein MANES_05G100502v8 [Manihot esculenta]
MRDFLSTNKERKPKQALIMIMILIYMKILI